MVSMMSCGLTDLWVMFLEDGAVIVRLLTHWGVLWETEYSVLEHQVRHVLIRVVAQGVDPAVTNSVTELYEIRIE